MTCSKKSCKCKCRKAEEREQKNRQDFNNLESLLMNAVKIKRLTGKHPELDGFLMAEINRLAERLMQGAKIDIKKTIDLMDKARK